jgi:NAD(P)-dependent dehydrogenase (short-subunit alcohol dehydrogenase family)
MLLEDKVVIVSGIGPGLGQKLAALAAREGAKLAICARTPSKLDDAEAEILEHDPSAQVLKAPTDIRERAQCERLMARTVERFGRIDVLINSAYVTGLYQLAAEADLDDWRATMDINLFGAMNMVQSVVPRMKAQGGGSIVNVNTKVSRMPLATMGGYAVSKAALRMATTQLAKELGADRIRLNSIFPGWMWGPVVERGMQARADAAGVTLAEMRAQIAKDIPLGDIPEDGECAKAVVALASDYFSAVTGACLDLSAGEYMPL